MKLAGVTVDLKQMYWLALDSVLRIFIGLAGSILFARLAGPEFYGKYQYVFSLSTFGSLFMLPGFNSGLINSASNGNDADFDFAARRKLRLFPAYCGLFALMGGAVCFLRSDSDVAIGCLIAGVLGSLSSVLSGYACFFIGKRDYRSLCIWNSLLGITTLLPGLLSYLFIAFCPTMMKVSVVSLVSQIWQLAVYGLIFRNVQKKLHSSKRNLTLESYSYNLTVMAMVGGAQGYLDQFLVGTFVNYSSLAQYNIAKRFFDILKSVWGVSQNYLQPRLVNISSEDGKKYFLKYLRILWLLVPALAVFYCLLPFVVKIFYGAGFAVSVIYARLFIFVFLCSIPNFFVEAYLRAIQSYSDLWITRIVSGCMLLLVLPLVSFWQVEGLIACRLLTAALISSVMVFVLYYRRNEM